MGRNIPAFTAVSLAVVMNTLAAQAQTPTVPAIVDPVANAAVAGGHCMGLAVGVDQDGVASEQFYGTSDTKRPFDGQTEFEIDSITKTFTALVLALATQRAKNPMQLDDSLQKYAPAGIKIPLFGSDPVRLVDLATHTAGLPRKQPGNVTQARPEVWTYTAGLMLNSDPGTKFLYSNLGFGLLGMAEEDDQKQTLEQIFQREITGPLGMSDTRIALTKEQLARKAQGHHPNGAKSPNDDPTVKEGVLGAFAINSTLDDMMKYLEFQMGGGTGALMQAALLTQVPVHPTGPKGQVGLAWNTNQLKDGTPFINKDGSGPGFTAYIAFTPSTHQGVVVLANQTSCGVPGISFSILSALNHGAAADQPDFGPDDAADEAQ